MPESILTVTSNGLSEIVNFKSLERNKKIGEKKISLDIFHTLENQHAYELLKEEAILDFDNDSYRIKQLKERSKNTQYYKEIVATHLFFDLRDIHCYEIVTEYFSIHGAMNFTLKDTGYTYQVIGTFSSKQFENFGDSDRLSLFFEVLERFGAEFEIKGTQITIKKTIGRDTDIQYRYKHNIKNVSRNVDTTNLANYIEGFGADGLHVVYEIPNQERKIHAKPVRDEKYTSRDSLLERLKKEIEASWDLQFDVDFLDLLRAGYPYEQPSEGDNVFLIFEPINIDVEVRLTEITEEFNSKGEILSTKVSLGTPRKTFTQQFTSQQKRFNDLFENGIIKKSVLDIAVQRATDYLLSAATELEFENGIIARSKDNPNQLVLINSNGIGISNDGGQTFSEAITGEGFVLSAGVIGQLQAENIIIGDNTDFEGTSFFSWDAGGFVATNPNNSKERVKFTSGGIFLTTDGGNTYQTAITPNGVVARELVATNDAEKGMMIQNDSFIVDDGVYARSIFDLDSTLPTMYDGNFSDAKIKGYGKIYTTTVRFYIPSGSYEPVDNLSVKHVLEDKLEVAMGIISHITFHTSAKEWYAYEVVNERKSVDGTSYTNGNELGEINVRLSPRRTHTEPVSRYVDVNVMIVGWR